MKSIDLVLLLLIIVLCSCDRPKNEIVKLDDGTSRDTFETTGSIERLDPALDEFIERDAKIEILADGFTWTEGPLWVEDGAYLLFSDIPPNRIMKWSESEGVSLYLEPSGYTGSLERGGEPGSNGLLLDQDGALVLCQHGDRRIARMLAPLSAPKAEFETLVGTYNGMKFNSPNDAIFDQSGNLYFTDPPYGLVGNMDDPNKEIEFQGVYRFGADRQLSLLTHKIPRPNGIGLSIDEKTLYVASSEKSPMWTAITLDAEGNALREEVFYDSTVRDGLGAPDGLKVDRNGIIWATGPGGVWVFEPSGKVLGRVLTGERTSNCAFNEDESILYMTCDDYLMRLRLK